MNTQFNNTLRKIKNSSAEELIKELDEIQAGNGNTDHTIDQFSRDFYSGQYKKEIENYWSNLESIEPLTNVISYNNTDVASKKSPYQNDKHNDINKFTVIEKGSEFISSECNFFAA